MVARVVKHEIRHMLRKLDESTDSLMFASIADILNSVFSKNSYSFWQTKIYAELSRRYPGWEVTEEERKRERNLLHDNAIFIYSLGKRIASLGTSHRNLILM